MTPSLPRPVRTAFQVAVTVWVLEDGRHLQPNQTEMCMTETALARMDTGEANRRILQNAATFLDAQQLEKVRGRFEQRAAVGRAAERVQQAERAAPQ